MRGGAELATSRHGVRVGQHLVLEALREQDGRTPEEVARRLKILSSREEVPAVDEDETGRAAP